MTLHLSPLAPEPLPNDATPARPPRQCLMCQAPFVPAHRGAWVCEPCRASDEWQHPVSFLHGTTLSRLRRALNGTRVND